MENEFDTTASFDSSGPITNDRDATAPRKVTRLLRNRVAIAAIALFAGFGLGAQSDPADGAQSSTTTKNITSLQDQKSDLQDKNEDLMAEKSALETEAEQLATDKTTLESAKAQLETTNAQLEADKASLAAELAAAQAQLAAAQQSASAAATAPAPAAPAPAAPAPAPAAGSAYYPNCDAAKAAGAAPIYAGEPGYAAKLDRDGDGVACE